MKINFFYQFNSANNCVSLKKEKNEDISEMSMIAWVRIPLLVLLLWLIFANGQIRIGLIPAIGAGDQKEAIIRTHDIWMPRMRITLRIIFTQNIDTVTL